MQLVNLSTRQLGFAACQCKNLSARPLTICCMPTKLKMFLTNQDFV